MICISWSTSVAYPGARGLESPGPCPICPDYLITISFVFVKSLTIVTGPTPRHTLITLNSLCNTGVIQTSLRFCVIKYQLESIYCCRIGQIEQLYIIPLNYIFDFLNLFENPSGETIAELPDKTLPRAVHLQSL